MKAVFFVAASLTAIKIGGVVIEHVHNQEYWWAAFGNIIFLSWLQVIWMSRKITLED